jgi:hypothetical protein
MEYPRTQTEYENSYTFKMFLFQVSAFETFSPFVTTLTKIS